MQVKQVNMHTTIKGEKARAEIVESARQLFYQHGYERTSFADIVNASGLLRGNIYHYFKTKEEILLAVIDQHLKDFRGLLEKWDEKESDPKTSLLAFVDMVVGRRSELVEYGCPVGSLNIELAKDQREVQQYAAELFDLFRSWLAENFRRMGRGAEADALAVHLLGRAQGIAVISQVYRDEKMLKQETKLLREWIENL